MAKLSSEEAEKFLADEAAQQVEADKLFASRQETRAGVRVKRAAARKKTRAAVAKKMTDALSLSPAEVAFVIGS